MPAITPYVGSYVCTSMLGRAPGQVNLSDDAYLTPVDGIALRISWAYCEPNPREYRWDLLDNELRRIRQFGKKWSLTVLAGANSPPWIFQPPYSVPFTVHGSDTSGIFDVEVCRILNIPHPWYQSFIDLYNGFMSAIRAHIIDMGCYDLLTKVKPTGVCRFTGENRMPARTSELFVNENCSLTNDRAILAAAGYTPQKILDAFTATTDHLAAIFPDKLLAQEVLDNQDYPLIDNSGNILAGTGAPGYVNVREAMYDLAVSRYPGRFSVQWNGLQRGFDVADTLAVAEAKGLIVGIQSNQRAGSGASCSRSPTGSQGRCDAQGLKETYNDGLARNFEFFEVWERDAIDYPEVIEYLNIVLQAKYGSPATSSASLRPRVRNAKLTYPLTIAGGSLGLTTDYPGKIREAIISAVLTARGERVYRADTYGLAASPLNVVKIPDILADCREAINYGLEGYPDVTFKLAGGLGLDEGTVNLDVTYMVGDSEPETLEIPLVVLPG